MGRRLRESARYDGIHQCTYDAEGRIKSIDSNTYWSVYDAFGNRVEENLGAPGVTDWVFGPSGKPIWGFTADNQNTGGLRTEVYAGGAHLATYRGSSLYFDYGDHLGSVRVHGAIPPPLISDVCQNLAFGDGLDCAGVLPNRMHFTDQPLDPHGLTHFQYRDLSTTQGRWVVPDPAGLAAVDPANPQTWNQYAYVLSNPMSFIDPLGLCGMDEGALSVVAAPMCEVAGGGGSPRDEAPPDDGGTPGGGQGSGGNGQGAPLSGETLGVPNWLPLHPPSILELLGLAPDMQCDFGVCVPIGNGVVPAAVAAVPCLANPVCTTILIGGTIAVLYGPQIVSGIKELAKGGTQNIPPSWLTDRPLPGESADEFARRVCTARYGSVAGCGSGPGSEFNKIKKWAQEWINKHGQLGASSRTSPCASNCVPALAH